MKDELINIGGHGLGDCLLSLQISNLLSKQGVKHKNLISTRKEVFEALEYLYKGISELTNIPEDIANNNAIEKNPSILKQIQNIYNSENITYNVPDLLFRNPLALDFNKYNLNLPIIKKTRTLLDKNPKKEKIIYCGLCSNTKGYLYKDIPSLLIELAVKLPDYTIYFPYLKHWVREIEYTGNFNQTFPQNVLIHESPEFKQSMDYLVKSCYGIFTCNGPSHIAYNLGIPRTILDPQFYNPVCMVRWKQDYDECIPIYSSVKDVSELVFNNITCPQTTLIDRKIILDALQNGYNNWGNLLYFKY
jgi:hypothetical protein